MSKVAKVPNAVEKLPKFTTAWVGCTSVTDDRQTTDGRATENSERERSLKPEFIFICLKNNLPKYRIAHSILHCCSPGLDLTRADDPSVFYMCHIRAPTFIWSTVCECDSETSVKQHSRNFSTCAPCEALIKVSHEMNEGQKETLLPAKLLPVTEGRCCWWWMWWWHKQQAVRPIRVASATDLPGNVDRMYE